MRSIAAFASLLLLALGFSACSVKDPKNPKFVVAEVGSEKIKRAELDAEVARMIQRIGMEPGQLSPEQSRSLEWYTLNEMVERRLVSTSLSEKDRTSVQTEVDQRIGRMKQQFGDEAQYQDALKQEGIAEEEIRAGISHDAALKAILGAKKPSASPEEAREFYDANPSLWKQAEQVRARHVLIRSGAEATIEQSKASQKSAESALARVNKGEDFASVAAEVSEDPGSKTQGGELPPFGRGQMVPEFEKVAFATPAGKTSKVFKTDYGYHFLQVMEKQPARTVPFDEVAPRIMEAVVQQKQAEAARQLLADLKAKTPVKIHIPEPNAESSDRSASTEPVEAPAENVPDQAPAASTK